jgi:hypothetical protein
MASWSTALRGMPYEPKNVAGSVPLIIPWCESGVAGPKPSGYNHQA